MRSSRFELKVKSELESLEIIGDFIAETLGKFGVGEATIYQVQLAADEACTNIIKYAYPEGEGSISLVLDMANDDLVVTITDRGKPFDPDSISPPDLSADLDTRKVGGLGIYFIRKLMDDVSYTFDPQKGNQLTMLKRLGKMTPG